MPNRKEAFKPPAKTPGTALLPFLRIPALPAAALAVIAAIFAGVLYLPSLQYGGVWDDSLLMVTKGHGGPAAEGFRPLLGLIQRAEWALGAGNPSLFHLTNLLFHVAGTWLCFRLALHLGASSTVAFLTALLFGAHPVHVESVAFVSGRPAMMSAVFSLGAILAARTATLCSLQGSRSKTIWWAYALYIAAALTHESALFVPFLLFSIDRWGPNRIPFRQRRVHYAAFMAFWAMTALRPLLDSELPPRLMERGVPDGQAVAALFFSAVDYVKMLYWPWPLNAIRSLATGTAAAGGAWMAGAALFAAVAVFAWWRRHDPLARCGALVLALGVLSVLPYPWLWNPYASERLAYFPSFGAVLLVGSLLAWLGARPGPARTAAAAGGVVLVMIAMVTTAGRIPVWRDNVTLLQSAADASPNDPEPHLQLAAHYAARNDAEAALASLDRALERDSTLVEAQSRRALILGTLGRWAEAEAAARRATGIDPKNAEAWANLGDALAQQGKHAEGVAASRRAVELDATQAALWYNYGVSLAATQDVAGATEAYRRALSIDSTNVGAWNNLGAIHGGQGRLEEARDAYEKAVELAPTSLQARMNLALAYLRLGEKERAAEERAVIQRMDPAAARQLTEFFRELDAEPASPSPRR